jgi:hypothetical protein
VNLRQLQTEFLRGVLGIDDSIVTELFRADGLAAEKRLAIYQNNVFSNFSGALQAVYPVILRLVGEEFFGHAADRFIRRYPSSSGDIHHFGKEFAEFLAHFPGAAGLPYLADAARLEWLVHEVFHEADHHPMNLKKLQQIRPEQYPTLRLKVHPAARLIASEFPIRRIWQVNQPEYAGDQTVDLNEGAEKLLIVRRKFVVEVEPLSVGEFTMLSGFLQEVPFAAALEQTLFQAPDFEAGTFLQRRVLDATIVGFEQQQSFIG